MNDPRPDNLSWIDVVADQFEEAWKQGRRPRLEEYLGNAPEPKRSALFHELLAIELYHRWRMSEAPTVHEYQQRFPEHVTSILAAFNATKPPQARAQGTASTVRPSAGPVLPAEDSGATPYHVPGAPYSLPERFGRYRILKPLGRGQMGAVYLAEDTHLDRPVALKVPCFSADEDPEMLARFLREARAAATLAHPNLCPVYDAGEIDGVHFLSMAYIEGKPLTAYLKSGQPLAPLQVAAVVRKLAMALDEAHRKGVIHRDLKPANILINTRREPVVVDFGLARRTGRNDARLTQAGCVLGTPAYMAPEQASGDPRAMGPACDIYSLGVILYEMLTGRLPFHGDVSSVLAQILTEQPQPPSTHRPNLDPLLDSICLKAMAKKSEDRYGTMADLAAALTSFLRNQKQGVETALVAGLTEDPQAEPGRVNREKKEGRATPTTQKAAGRLRTTVARTHRRLPWIWLASAAAAAALLVLGGVLFNALLTGPPKTHSANGDKTGDLSGSPQASGEDYPVETVAVLGSHLDKARCVAFHPHEHFAVSGGDDGLIRLWNLKTLAEVPGRFKGKTDGVNSVAFSPDGRQVLSGNDDGTVRFFDFASGEATLGKKMHAGRATCVAFSSDGSLAVSGGEDHRIRVWDPKTGDEKHCLEGHSDEVIAVAASPDGKRVLSGAEDGSFCLWDVEKEQVLMSRSLGKGHAYTGIVYFADGRRALCSSYDDELYLWSLADDEGEIVLPHFKGHRDSVLSVALSRDEQRALSGCNDGALFLWDVKSGGTIPAFKGTGHTGEVCRVAISPNGQFALSAGEDKTVRLWRLKEVGSEDK